MDVEIFTICDAATISGGKLNILGSFDQLHSARFPFQHPDCSLAAKFRFDTSEEGDHVVEFRVIDMDGKQVVQSVEQKLRIPPNQNGKGAHLHINRLSGLPFQRPGEYYLDLLVDHQVRARIPLHVQLAVRVPL